MSKSRLVFESMMRDASEEIAFERRVRLGLASDEGEALSDLRALSLDDRVSLAGMAAVFLGEES